MPSPIVLQWLALFGISAAIGFSTFRLMSAKPEATPVLGSRGERRQRAVERYPLFALFEPAIRLVGAWFAAIPLDASRAKVEKMLADSGYYLGVTADEYMALRAFSVVVFGVIGVGIGRWFGATMLFGVVGMALGPLLVSSQFSGERTRRFKEVSRGLPGEIDMTAMCMNAGMDFPGAVRLIVSQRTGDDDVLRDEFVRILAELELGHTRAVALRNFEARVPTEAVREFVGAVVQAEEKGTPLAEVLKIQAGILRMRRTVLAEEAASRAGVMMMIPLMMLLGSILIILMGSMMLRSFDSGFLG
ncbi:MAG TPA: type II secretion system F family protein [Polyangiales bacterium]|nr:type II secretion system F family protein [Polyangiales bacterium]